MQCLILAGGFATRLYPLTVNRAKALLEYLGKPVISHVIDRVPPGMPIVVTTNRRFERDFLEWQKTIGRPVEVLVEEARSDEHKMGAVGAIDHWVRQKPIRDDLLVIAADNYFEFDLAAMVAEFDGRHAFIAVHDVGSPEQACDIAKACQVGLAVLEKGRVVRFDEKPEHATSSTVSTGIYIIPSRLFPTLADYVADGKKDNLGSFVSYLLQRGEDVLAYSFTGAWIDIGDEINRGRLKV